MKNILVLLLATGLLSLICAGCAPTKYSQRFVAEPCPVGQTCVDQISFRDNLWLHPGKTDVVIQQGGDCGSAHCTSVKGVNFSGTDRISEGLGVVGSIVHGAVAGAYLGEGLEKMKPSTATTNNNLGLNTANTTYSATCALGGCPPAAVP